MARRALSQKNESLEERPLRPVSTLTLDIETSPRIGLFFGSTYKPNIGKVVQESIVYGFSWKPLGKKVRSCYIWDFPLYKKDPLNDIEVVKKWVEVVSGNIVIGQNSRAFDDKVMMGRVIVHQLEAPIPFMTIDTMADTKAIARYDSNKLDDVSKQYGFGGKNPTGGMDLWWDCLEIPGWKKADPKQQKKMVRYCERDVELTEKRYLHERPYYKRHPAMNVLENKPDLCPRCAKGKVKDLYAYNSTKVGQYMYGCCQNPECGFKPKYRTPEYRAKEDKVKWV